MHSEPASQTIDVLINSVDGAIDGKHQVWVAEAFARIIGSAAVISDSASLAHLRYLCVAPDVTERDVVARTLAETAIRDAWERGYLKLLVHTSSPPDRPAAFLHQLGFEFSREHSSGGERVLEFYLNLYERPRPA
jgi:N-acetylglutamate synthase-like GNAT family acetyltransferase